MAKRAKGKNRFRNISFLTVALLLVVLMIGMGTAEGSLARIEGKDRYETAARVAGDVYASSRTVIIARGDAEGHFADGLASSVLAGVLDVPVLLTRPNTLPATVEKAIRDLGATEALILGGTEAISSGVVSSLKKLDLTVQRIAGKDRYETAVKVAKEAKKRGWIARHAFIVNGQATADALVSASAAFKDKAVILQVTKGTIPQVTKDALKDLGIDDVYIIGGTSVVSNTVRTALSKQVTVKARLGGDDRYETSVLFAKRFFPHEARMVLAGGLEANIVDSIGAGIFGKPILYVRQDRVPKTVEKYLEATVTDLSEITVVGGTAAVSRAVVRDVEQIVEEDAGSGGPTKTPVSAISVDPVEMYLELNKTATITATVLPNNATNKRVTWSTSDEEVATIDDSGLVTAVATGTATITATTVDKGFTATCVVTVAWDGETAVEPKNEDGAYIINHAGEFAWFMGRNVTGQTIVINNDIDLSGEEWTPLANSNYFVIDGNGHTIRNFTLAMGGQDGLGMFGRKGINGATIKNLVIEDVSFTGTPGNLYYAGVLVGDFHNGTIENIIVRNVSVSAQKWAGAVAGQVMNSDLKNITVEGSSVELTDGQSKAGGVTGSWRFESGKDAGTAENLVVRNSFIRAPKQAGGIIGNIDSRVAGIQMIDCISENNTIKSVAEDLAGCLVADVYHGGSDYPDGVILTIHNPVVDGNTINGGPSDRLVGGNEELWVEIDVPWYDPSETSFTISTAEELIGLSMLVNNGIDFDGKTITLGANIDLREIEWSPIGNKSRECPFSGEFDGNHKTISNLTFSIDDTSGYYGMFGYLSGAMVKDISFVGANVSGGFRLGVLCGYADSSTTIDEITVDQTSVISNTRHAAGICGEFYGVIRNCLNEAAITSDSEWGAAAGIVAWLGGTAEDCKNNALMTSQQKNGVAGGIAGYVVDATINSCLNNGAINVAGGVTHAYAGGIAGYTEGEVVISDCINVGLINADDGASNTTAFKRCAGGIVGYHNTGIVTIDRSVNTGTVAGYNYAGGILGHIVSTGYCNVKYCYNDGTITSNYAKDVESPSYASGIVGYTGNYKWEQQTVEHCLNAGIIENNAEIGDALQVAHDPINSYYIETDVYYVATDALDPDSYDDNVESLALLLNTGLEPGSEFWGVVEGVVKPLVLTDYR